MTTSNREVLFTLPDGRTLAYESNGTKDSPLLIIFFHGVFSCGKAGRESPVLRSKNAHFVAPTLPGWGLSSPRPKKTLYALELANDITSLIQHLYPDSVQRDKLQIYVCGGSFGTVPAQMLYGLPPQQFPLVKQVKGLLVIAPFSPFRHHAQHAQDMTWQNYMVVGAPARLVPFKLLPRLAVSIVKPKAASVEAMDRFLRESMFDKMGEKERAEFKEYTEREGRTEDEVKREWAENAVKSVSKSWEGFMDVSDILYQDWGFEPKSVTSEGRRVSVVSSEGDDMAPESMGKWLATQYGNAKLKILSGGHIASLYHIDRIWTEFLEGVEWHG